MKRDDVVWILLVAALSLFVFVGTVFALKVANPGWLLPIAADPGPARPEQLKTLPTDHPNYHPEQLAHDDEDCCK